jgi:hypothetical protein
MALRTKHGIFFVFIRVFFPLLGGVEVQHIGSAAAVKCMHLELNPAVKASFEMFKLNNIFRSQTGRDEVGIKQCL